MTETWLNENFLGSKILPSGFKILRKDRPIDQRGGGVLIVIRDCMPYKKIFASESPDWSGNLEIVAVEIEMKNKKNG